MKPSTHYVEKQLEQALEDSKTLLTRSSLLLRTLASAASLVFAAVVYARSQTESPVAGLANCALIWASLFGLVSLVTATVASFPAKVHRISGTDLMTFSAINDASEQAVTEAEYRYALAHQYSIVDAGNQTRSVLVSVSLVSQVLMVAAIAAAAVELVN